MNEIGVIPLQVGQLESNSFILYAKKSEESIVIDPGDDAEYIIQKHLDHNLKPTAILATHGHFDHVLAGFTLQAAYNTSFYIHKDDEFLLNRMRETAKHFTEVDPGPAPIVTKYFTKEGDLQAGDITLHVIQTPGHTPGSVSFYDQEHGVVFVGDLFFADGSIGEVTHSYSNRAQIKESIKKIFTLPEETIVYPGHGESATIEDLREKFEWALRGI